RQQVLEAIERIAKAAAMSARADEPIIKVDENFTPSLFNDEKLTAETVSMFHDVLGNEFVHERPMSLGGEDFSRFIRAGVPGFYYFVGSAPPERVAAAHKGGEQLTKTHTDKYFPIPEPTIKTGVLTMTAAVLRIVGKK
ncbi:MAG: metal-dependent amidase/aminoacylase/carboxypeptidase family protein, partial [Pirellulaceae bacterium]